MQLLSNLNRFMGRDKKAIVTPPPEDQLETRPMRIPKDFHERSERTRPSQRINDQKWLKIQKAIDQAG